MGQKHTPGPWVHHVDGSIGHRRGTGWLEVVAAVDGDTEEETEANANLIAAAPALLESLAKLVGDLDDLIADSDGVYGLHRNGDGAPWSELTTGGRFESWLKSLDDARAILANTKGEPAHTAEKPVGCDLVAETKKEAPGETATPLDRGAQGSY